MIPVASNESIDIIENFRKLTRFTRHRTDELLAKSTPIDNMHKILFTSTGRLFAGFYSVLLEMIPVRLPSVISV